MGTAGVEQGYLRQGGPSGAHGFLPSIQNRVPTDSLQRPPISTASTATAFSAFLLLGRDPASRPLPTRPPLVPTIIGVNSRPKFPELESSSTHRREAGSPTRTRRTGFPTHTCTPTCNTRSPRDTTQPAALRCPSPGTEVGGCKGGPWPPPGPPDAAGSQAPVAAADPGAQGLRHPRDSGTPGTQILASKVRPEADRDRQQALPPARDPGTGQGSWGEEPWRPGAEADRVQAVLPVGPDCVLGRKDTPFPG